MIVVTTISLVVAIGFYYISLPMQFSAPAEDDLLETKYVTSQTITHSIDADDEGNLVLNGEDCYFEVTGIEHPGKTVVLFFASPLDTAAASFTVTVDHGEGYVEDGDAVMYIPGDKYADCLCISMPSEDYTALRIRPNMTLQISKIEIHEGEPVKVEKPYPNTKKNILKGTIVGLFVSFVILLLEAAFSFSGMLCDAVKKNKRYLLEDAGAVIIVGVISHLIMRGVFGGDADFGAETLLACVILSVALLVRNHILHDLSAERTFFALILLAGFSMTLCCRPHMIWDAFVHYSETLQATTLLDEFPVTEAHTVFAGVTGVPEVPLRDAISYLNEKGLYLTSWVKGEFRLIRLPAAVWMVLGNMLHVSAYTNFIMGRLGELLVFALCGYFGMKRLHSGKMIFGVIYLFPVNLFLATNYSYDYLCTGFLMLGMAYFVGMCQEKDEDVKAFDVIVMLASLYIGCMPKMIYVPIFLFPFLLCLNKTKNKKKLYYGLCTLAIIVAAVSFVIASRYNLDKGGDARVELTGVEGVSDPTLQMQYILSHPAWYAVTLIKYLLWWWNPVQVPTGTFLAYYDTAFGYIIMIALLIFVSLTDRDVCDKKAYPLLAKIYSVLFFIGDSVLIVTAIYVAFSPVGSDYMKGAQPRYFIPLIYPMCAMLAGEGFSLKKYIPARIYNALILTIMVGLNFYAVYDLML